MAKTKLANRLQQWMEGRPPGVQIIALIAAASDVFFGTVRAVHRQADLYSALEAPPLEVWLRFYDMPEEQMFRAAVAPFARDHPVFANLEELIDSIGQVPSEPVQVIRADVVEVIESICFPPRSNSRAVPNRSGSDSIGISPEMLFLLRVYVPCLALAGVLPGHLLKGAAAGDGDSLELLLKLDKSAIYAPGIPQLVYGYAQKPGQFGIKQIGKYLAARISKPEMKRVKITVMAFIQIAGEMLGMKLNTGELVELFDAIHAMRTGDIRDPDLLHDKRSVKAAIKRRKKEILEQFQGVQK